MVLLLVGLYFFFYRPTKKKRISQEYFSPVTRSCKHNPKNDDCVLQNEFDYLCRAKKNGNPLLQD